MKTKNITIIVLLIFILLVAFICLAISKKISDNINSEDEEKNVLITAENEYEQNYDNRIDEILADDVEIEKKWLIDSENIPYDFSNAEIFEIEQTYICFEPEMRVRRINNGKQYSFAIKRNTTSDGMIRDEYETSITKTEYENLLDKKEDATITIHKTRYQLLDDDGELVAIDIFHDELNGLAYMEIEFANEEEANNYETPDWVIKDVTDDKYYKNGYLARYGIPEE